MADNQQNQLDRAILENARPVFALSNYEVRREDSFPDYDFLLEIDGRTFLPRYEITAIFGRKKSGKSSFMRDIVRALSGAPGAFARRTGSDALTIGYFDTEMSPRNTHQIYDNLPTNAPVYAYNIATLDETNAEGEPLDFMGAIMSAVQPGQFDVIVIDTITEAIADFNDPKTSREMALKFSKWAKDLRLTVIAVMHTNKSDNTPAGHWGNAIQRKDFDGFLVTMDEGYTSQSIKHIDAREAPAHLIPTYTCKMRDGVRCYEREGLPGSLDVPTRKARK